MNYNLTGWTKSKKTHSNFTVDLIKLINLLQKKGFKAKAINLLLNSFIFLKLKTKKSPLRQFYKVCMKIKPLVELKNIKLGSTKYLVPTPLSFTRQLLLGLRILIKNARNRAERLDLSIKLANEIFETNRRKGETYKQLKVYFNLINQNISNFKFSKLTKSLK